MKSLLKVETNAPIFNNITHPVSLQIGVATNCQIKGTKRTYQKNKQDLWSTSRKMAKILPIFFLMTIICNKTHSSTDNMIRSSLVIPNRGSTVKPASIDTSEFVGQTRTKLSRSDQSQRMQLTNLNQTVQQQPTPTAHSVQCLRTNDTEAFFLTNGCTGITTSPHMKLFSMGSLPLCTTANLWGNIYDPNSPTGQFRSLIERTTNPFPYSVISPLPISVRIIATIMFFTVTFFCVILPIKSGPFAGLTTDQPTTVGAPPMLMIGQDDASTQIRDFRARPAVLEAVSG